MALAVLGGVVLSTAEVAGSLGVPYISTVASIVQLIQDSCQRVTLHNKKCEALSNKARTLLVCFMEKSRSLDNSELRTHADQLQSVLEMVSRRMSEWAQIGRMRAFLRDGEVARQIEKADGELDNAVATFQLNATMDAHFSLERLDRKVEVIFERFVANPTEGIKRIQEYQTSDREDITEPMMRIGQKKLKSLRQSEHGSGSPSENLMAAIQGRKQECEKVERALTELYRKLKIPPTIKILDGEVTREDSIPMSGGLYSDVWIGWWLSETKVALKALREVRTTNPKAVKRFEQELKVWSCLSHPNILQFLGLVTDIGHFLQIVSPWQENGNILNFVQSNPTADRIQLLTGASYGLTYLHEKGIVHGNLRCSNILVSDKNEALVCDFGMSKVVEDITDQFASITLTKAGSSRWLAPELMEGTINFPDMACDVYSFGMTMYECLTGSIPFASLKKNAQVIRKVTQEGARPERPLDGDGIVWMTDSVREILQMCWNEEPKDRLRMTDVGAQLAESGKK
ncbi:hypothetical protein QCA50_013569 [Cerrena zonata]|uniref:Protein kinase domain-containing protein n=1 Tax=Cerrena zonata TaxID=2478898 RepID=A0AAW0G178_9APHY